MGTTTLWELLLYGNYYFMGITTLWELLLYGNYYFMGTNLYNIICYNSAFNILITLFYFD